MCQSILSSLNSKSLIANTQDFTQFLSFVMMFGEWLHSHSLQPLCLKIQSQSESNDRCIIRSDMLTISLSLDFFNRVDLEMSSHLGQTYHIPHILSKIHSLKCHWRRSCRQKMSHQLHGTLDYTCSSFKTISLEIKTGFPSLIMVEVDIFVGQCWFLQRYLKRFGGNYRSTIR